MPKYSYSSIQPQYPLLILLRWDGNAESLSTTLNQILPHVFPKTQSPAIPLNPPKNFSDISIEKENTENIC